MSAGMVTVSSCAPTSPVLFPAPVTAASSSTQRAGRVKVNTRARARPRIHSCAASLVSPTVVAPPDVNECLDQPCSHSCFNTYGSFICSCEEGFELTSDGTSCIGETEELADLIDLLVMFFN